MVHIPQIPLIWVFRKKTLAKSTSVAHLTSLQTRYDEDSGRKTDRRQQHINIEYSHVYDTYVLPYTYFFQQHVIYQIFLFAIFSSRLIFDKNHWLYGGSYFSA